MHEQTPSCTMSTTKHNLCKRTQSNVRFKLSFPFLLFEHCGHKYLGKTVPKQISLFFGRPYKASGRIFNKQTVKQIWLDRYFASQNNYVRISNALATEKSGEGGNEGLEMRGWK